MEFGSTAFWILVLVVVCFIGAVILKFNKSFNLKLKLPLMELLFGGKSHKPSEAVAPQKAEEPRPLVPPGNTVPRNAITVVPDPADCHWSMGTLNDKPVMSVRVSGLATNTYAVPVRVATCRHGSAEVINTHVMIKSDNSGMFSSQHALPPHKPKEISIHFVMNPQVKAGEPYSFDAILIDQYGNENIIRGITCRGLV